MMRLKIVSSLLIIMVISYLVAILCHSKILLITFYCINNGGFSFFTFFLAYLVNVVDFTFILVYGLIFGTIVSSFFFPRLLRFLVYRIENKSECGNNRRC